MDDKFPKTKEEFLTECFAVGQDIFAEYDRKVIRKLSRVTRLGRCKAFTAGYNAAINLIASVQYPDPEFEGQPDQQPTETEVQPQT